MTLFYLFMEGKPSNLFRTSLCFPIGEVGRFLGNIKSQERIYVKCLAVGRREKMAPLMFVTLIVSILDNGMPSRGNTLCVQREVGTKDQRTSRDQTLLGALIVLHPFCPVQKWSRKSETEASEKLLKGWISSFRQEEAIDTLVLKCEDLVLER